VNPTNVFVATYVNQIKTIMGKLKFSRDFCFFNYDVISCVHSSSRKVDDLKHKINKRRKKPLSLIKK